MYCVDPRQNLPSHSTRICPVCKHAEATYDRKGRVLECDKCGYQWVPVRD